MEDEPARHIGRPRPGLTLDELLAELQRRLTSVATDRDRLRSLLDAVLAVGSDLDLQAVLHRITEVAAVLADASYAALGVISADGTGLSQFLVVGVDDDEAARIGPLPAGHGVLGTLISDPRPLRLDDLATAPESWGFPPGHPAMHTFLGVPVRVHGTVFGNLYLTEKRGGGPFTDDDEEVVGALAVAAGIAIWNARLYGESREREKWLQADADVATALLSGTDPEHVLQLVAARARAVTHGRLALVALPSGDGRLLVEVADGELAAQVQGQVITPGAALQQVLTGRVARALSPDDLPFPAASHALAVPLSGPAAGLGLLVVTGLAAPDLAAATRVLSGFAAQASVALELAARRDEVQRYAVFEDRDRIARDLHDLVIQRLFATGMQLEGASRLIASRPEEAARRVRVAVDDLDATIRELRSAIYGLQAPADGAPSLRAQLLQAVDAGAEVLGFPPTLQFEGLLDTLVPADVADDLLAVVREALTNAARHAGAEHVGVRIVVRRDAAVLEVTDDGAGPGTGRRSGLSNLTARAQLHGGACTLRPGSSRGSVLVWSVPLTQPAAPAA